MSLANQYMTGFDFDPQRYPTQPGCYLMKDASGDVIYVGKGKNLRRRLSSYFQARRKSRRTRRLVARIGDIQVILANNETESLILENNLIKRYQPRYNRMLVKQDSGYSYIALTDEPFPRFVPYRKHRVNKELEGTQARRRFGPYVSRRFRDVLLEFLIDTFKTRTCRHMPAKACLSYQIEKCSGICQQKVSAEAYADAVERGIVFLSRRHTQLIRQMKVRMRDCAERLEFERAQRIKNQVEALESALERQIVERDVPHDQDVIFFGERAALVTHIKRGTVQGLSWLDLDLTSEHAAACEQFLIHHYARECPEELIVNQLRNPAQVALTLTESNQRRIAVTLPIQGTQRGLLRFCELNYNYRASTLRSGS